MRRNSQAISRAVQGIFASYCRLKTDEGMIGAGQGLRPDLHILQRVYTLLGQFCNRQSAGMWNLDGHLVRERIRIIGRVRIPIKGTNLKSWRAISDKSCLILLSYS